MAPPAPSSTTILAFGGLYALVAVVFALGVLQRRSSRDWYIALFGVFAFAAVAACLLTGKRHDYFHFVGQWENTMDGGDPWDQTLELVDENSGYGPLFNVFAPLAEVHELLPKTLFALAWVATAAGFVRLFAADDRLRRLAPFVFAYFALNPYFWIEISLYGHFDILPSAAVLLAVHAVLRGRELQAGATLAAGTLLKLTPVVALPFLVAAHPARWKAFVAGFAGVVVGVEVVAFAIWGTHAVTFPWLAADQESKLLSIFQFLRGDYSPLHLVSDSPNVDWLSLPLLVVAGLLLVWGLALHRAHLVVSVVTTFVVVLGLYLRGHQQFQMLVFVLVPYLALTLNGEALRSRLLWGTLALYLGWFSAFTAVYTGGGQLREEPWLRLRESLGLPTFVLTIVTVVVLLRFRNAELRLPPRVPSLGLGREAQARSTA
jgi:hypothetical protein